MIKFQQFEIFQAATHTVNNVNAVPLNTNYLKIVLGPTNELAQAEIRYHDSDLAEYQNVDASTFNFHAAGYRAEATALNVCGTRVDAPTRITGAMIGR